MAGVCLCPGLQGLAYAGRCIQPLLVNRVMAAAEVSARSIVA